MYIFSPFIHINISDAIHPTPKGAGFSLSVCKSCKSYTPTGLNPCSSSRPNTMMPPPS